MSQSLVDKVAVEQDQVVEARRVLDAARDAGVTLRATGGIAVAIRCPSARTPPLERTYHDIDFVGRSKEVQRIEKLLGGLGYVGDEHFNSLHGRARLIFDEPRNGCQVDIFIDRIEMCHKIELRDRLERCETTLTPADLLLSKLQVVETNRKDHLDIVALCADHELMVGDDEGIDVGYLTHLCSDDWGLWRTTTIVAGTAGSAANELGEAGGRAAVRLKELVEALEEAPKTRKWKLRSRVGERRRWYQVPEEDVEA